MNYVYVVGGNYYRSNVLLGMFGNWWAGADETGFDSAGGDYVSHEAAHMFGLPDDYTDVNGVSIANPGHEGHIMGEGGFPRGVPVQHEINSILKGRARDCECK